MSKDRRLPIPLAPSKNKRKIVEPTHIFKGTCLEKRRTRLPFTIPRDIHRFFYLKGAYSASERPCIEQPPQLQSCGTGAGIMLLSEVLKNDSKLTLKDSFWNWYLSTILASQCNIMHALYKHTNLKEQGYEVKSIFYHSPKQIENHLFKREGVDYVGVENHREVLLGTLKALGTLPLIVSITNPHIEGHWIVIDEFTTNGYVLVRDPYTGNAYMILTEELFENWPVDDEVKVIYITKEPETDSGKLD